MYSTIISLFIKNKSSLLKYVIILLVIISTISITYFKGRSDGISIEREKLSKEYIEIIEKKLVENTTKLSREFNEKLKIELANKKKEIVYVERKQNTKKLLEKSPNLNKQECDLSNEEFSSFNKDTRRIK